MFPRRAASHIQRVETRRAEFPQNGRCIVATGDIGDTRPRPRVLVVMGVSGSGKSTVAALAAERLGWTFADGDDFHTTEHVAKMKAGHALDDADRTPWLARIATWIRQRLAAGESAVVACSALKRAYRDALTGGHRDVRIVYLDGAQALVAGRLAARQGHFMAASLLASQFAILEPPGPDEHPITVGIDRPAEGIADAIVAHVQAEGAPASDARA